MIRRPPRSTRTDTPFPTRRSSDLVLAILLRCRAGPALERTAEARLLGIAEQGRDLVQRHFVLLQVLFAEFDALAFENVRKLQAVAAEIGLQRTHRPTHLLRAHFDRALAGWPRAAPVAFDAIDKCP